MFRTHGEILIFSEEKSNICDGSRFDQMPRQIKYQIFLLTCASVSRLRNHVCNKHLRLKYYLGISCQKDVPTSIVYKYTVCPRIRDRFYIVPYYMHWVKTYWTCSTVGYLELDNDLNKYIFVCVLKHILLYTYCSCLFSIRYISLDTTSRTYSRLRILSSICVKKTEVLQKASTGLFKPIMGGLGFRFIIILNECTAQSPRWKRKGNVFFL